MIDGFPMLAGLLIGYRKIRMIGGIVGIERCRQREFFDRSFVVVTCQSS